MSAYNLDEFSYKKACEVARHEYNIVCERKGLTWQEHDSCWNLYKAIVDTCTLAAEKSKSAPGSYVVEGRSWFARNTPKDQYLRSPFQQVSAK